MKDGTFPSLKNPLLVLSRNFGDLISKGQTFDLELFYPSNARFDALMPRYPLPFARTQKRPGHPETSYLETLCKFANLPSLTRSC